MVALSNLMQSGSAMHGSEVQLLKGWLQRWTSSDAGNIRQCHGLQCIFCQRDDHVIIDLVNEPELSETIIRDGLRGNITAALGITISCAL